MLYIIYNIPDILYNMYIIIYLPRRKTRKTWVLIVMGNIR